MCKVEEFIKLANVHSKRATFNKKQNRIDINGVGWIDVLFIAESPLNAKQLWCLVLDKYYGL